MVSRTDLCHYTEADARKAVAYLNSHALVGVDTETRPFFFAKGMVNQVALLQVATADACFLFRLNHIGLPDFLEEFLQNDVLKVGLSLKDDFRMLSRRNRQDPRTGNWVELQDYVPHFGIEEMSLQKIYALLFGGEDFENATAVQLGSGNADGSPAVVCGHRCLGLRTNL